LRAEGFSCSLGVLYGGLRISILQFFIKKNLDKYIAIFCQKKLNIFPAVCFFNSWVIKTMDPDLDSAKMLDSDPGSAALVHPQHWFVPYHSIISAEVAL
jgi:hypothetical protein